MSVFWANDRKHLIMGVMNIDSEMEKEKALDRARWDFLDGLDWQHAFDFAGLCIYRCKLLILEKWAARLAGNAAANLDAAADQAEKASENKKTISKQE